MRHRSDLSDRQRKALDALLSTPTVTAAAEKAGVGRATIYRYLADPEFSECYRQERTLLVEQTVAGLQKLGISAVGVLRRNFDAASPHVQIRAARTVLDLMFKGTELVEMEERVRALEEEADEERF